ncbi:glycosyltransferase family 15 protein [Backusella circina FSU 941]|nr:glycosyltransferase family 15 protein [Backusella circina FSU 941]
MGIRRYSCILFQLGIATYLLSILYYFFGYHGNNIRYDDHLIKPVYNRYSKEQPSSYTIGPRHDPNQMTIELPTPTNETERVNAAFIVLVRNTELYGMMQSMRDIEKTFNHKFGYPWVFLNDKPFSKTFINYTTSMTSSKTYYGLVNDSMWGYPEFIDQEKAARQRERLKLVPYGLSESYRHMCRFQSGFFWRHPLVLSLGLEYYWRVEPDVRYFCDLDYDPFLYMKKNNKKYAFNISFKEHTGTIPSLWKAVKYFARTATLKGKNYFPHPAEDSLYRFVTDRNGQDYNSCHFWTNFEIARLDLWQTEAYRNFFGYLDRSGGFFYERWGDAPVHSIFASLFLKKDEIHFFNDIGYAHSIYQHCPEQENLITRCSCDPGRSLDFTDHMSCLNEYMNAQKHRKGDGRTVNDVLLTEFE